MESHTLIKLCVIDDMKMVVDMISQKIAWLDHQIEIVGTALDGEAGLRLAQQMKPDIILTDIRMPRMDGLEMTQAILEASPRTKIIILSAYSDFSYAQQAIRLGAFDFVKKPFAIDEIVSVVLKAKLACEMEHKEQIRLKEMEQKIKESLPILRQEYLTLLLHHQTSEASARQRWEFLGVDLEPKDFVIFIVEIDQFMDKYQALPVQEIELIRFSLQNIMEETITSMTTGIIFREAINRYVVVMNCKDDQIASEIAEACCLNIARYTRFTVSIGVGLGVHGIHELPHSYRQALNALSYHFYTEGNGVFSCVNMAIGQRGIPSYSISKEQDFLFALRSGNSDKSQHLLEEIFNDLVDIVPLPEPQYVENVCYELSSKIFRLMLEKFPYETVHQMETKMNEFKSKSQPSLQEFRALLKELCLEGCAWIEKERSHESIKIIHQVKDYIRANLHMDLSLEHCSRQINLSQGYFSNLFKKVLGVSFQQFVIQEKMEKAKNMLIDDFQVQEIAQELGYEHRRYFSDIFKKHTGMTPSEFKISSQGRIQS
ncbi:response regulator [Paenibacillus sp. FSL H7-0331]|uniref:response regulator n=1 Tax=Paenibacillus sp. FSL H7-0331 TaxID=1920421 RepID=UPI00096FBE21|nr:response regulator [Paenibacillus sp. FSL H7-0331]OMF11638.1 DNA-binding response regulator [Paenibacillus sp. FSL H7-0331]